MFDPVFWVALVQIIGINIILSGDNAVVIALACRSLPPKQQKIGVLLGAGAAVVLRIIFTIFIVYLLAIPYLKVAGGLLLLWIGYKLMTEEEAGEGDIKESHNVMGAVRTILIADAVMSLDNVIAVAGAAESAGEAYKYILLILGLLISIPLVVYGATLMMVLIKRFPFIVTLGAALIGYIGGEVIITDKAIEPWIDANAHWMHTVIPLLGAVLVVDIGKLFAPKHVHEPHSVAEAVEAPAALFGLRALIVAFGGLVLTRAPLIVSFIAGMLGFMVGDNVIGAPAQGAAKTIMHSIGPFIGAGIALVIAEVAGRLFHRNVRERA